MLKTRICLIDISASMNQDFTGNSTNRLMQAKRCLLNTIINLRNQSPLNQVIIIAFADKPSLVYQGKVCNINQIKDAIHNLNTTEGTANLTAALTLVINVIQKITNLKISSIDIITDGIVDSKVNPKIPANLLCDRFGVRLYFYLIDYSQQGYKTALDIVRDDDDGKIEIIQYSQGTYQSALEILSSQLNTVIPNNPELVGGLKC
jgi:hypothetical protein